MQEELREQRLEMLAFKLRAFTREQKNQLFKVLMLLKEKRDVGGEL